MFTPAIPESVGISSKQILKYLRVLDERELSTHSILIARGDHLVCEAYWAPFTRETKHRMYSQTKSYVGLAVRLLAEDGLISLEDPIIKYFPDMLPETVHPYLKMMTIRNMLMMRTCFDDYQYGIFWFTSGTDDRVKLYFSNRPAMMPGTMYRYDSSGSFVLGALVERLTGKKFLDYLRDKCLNAIGFSADAYCLECPGGWSWGDSALVCTPLDMLKFGRFVGTKGRWEGRQILPARIFEEAFRETTDNFDGGYRTFGHNGYCSQFWHFYDNSVGFNGMHDQFTLYDPDTDITFTCTSGNFRNTPSRELLCSYLFTEIIHTAGLPMPEDPEAANELQDYIASRKLVTVSGMQFSPVEKEISGKTFVADQNPMGISDYSFTFGETECSFRYRNAQGEKTIRFGRSENIFQPFPETGYSDLVGGQSAPGSTYLCAASGAWGTENQLVVKVQIIDKYIGNLQIMFAYRDGYARLHMHGDAENFLTEYHGPMNANIRE